MNKKPNILSFCFSIGSRRQVVGVSELWSSRIFYPILHNSITPILLVILILSTVTVKADISDSPVINGPLTLVDAVQTALKYSPMVNAAQSQVTAAQARVGMARSMTRPQISASAFAGTSTMGDIITSPISISPTSIFSVPNRGGVTGQVGLMFPLFTGGRTSSAVRSAEALSTAIASDSTSVSQNTAMETKMAYHSALLASESVNVYTNLVTEEQERVRVAEAAFKEGKIAKFDLLRNQSALAESQQMLANSERDAKVTLIDLKNVMGISPASDLSLKDNLAYAEIPVDTNAYITKAEENRPEIKSVSAKVKSAEANLQLAKSAYKPQIYGNAMQGVSAVSGGTDTGFTVGVTVGIPLVDGGQRSSAVKEAQSMLVVMKQDERQALLDVQKDVQKVVVELQAADKNVRLADAAVDQAQEDYRVIMLRYEAGKSINVEVLDALASLVRAQNNRLTVLYEHNIAKDKLARALGEL